MVIAQQAATINAWFALGGVVVAGVINALATGLNHLWERQRAQAVREADKLRALRDERKAAYLAFLAAVDDLSLAQLNVEPLSESQWASIATPPQMAAAMPTALRKAYDDLMRRRRELSIVGGSEVRKNADKAHREVIASTRGALRGEDNRPSSDNMQRLVDAMRDELQ